MYKVVQKKVFQTVNSNGQKRTVMNIIDKTQNKEVRTRAVSLKKNPKDFLIVQQGVVKNGQKMSPFQKLYHMKEKDIHELFSSAEGVANKNLTNFGAKEIKIKAVKDVNDSNNNVKINLMEKEISAMSDKLKELKQKKKEKSKESKKSSSTIKAKKSSSKKILKSKSKKMKGGNKDGEVLGFDPHGNDWGTFQTVEQEKMMKTMQKGGLKEIITPEIQQHMADSLKLAVDSKTPGTPFKAPELKTGGKK
jgi:hypothetical protein